MKRTHALILMISALGFLASCSKDNNPAPPDNSNYTIPTTYTFANADYSNQTKLLAMADAIVSEINLANSVPNTVVTAQRLNDLLNNNGSPFGDASLNTSGLKLSDYCPASLKTDLLAYFDSIGQYSASAAAASQGVAGVAVSGSKKYLLSPTGVFYSQVVKKAIMGLCAYQIANVYLKDSISSTTDTAMLAHYWDAAFGFFGVPADFPATTTGSKYFGSYSNQVDAGLHSNATIMNAFLKGRAAISHNDITVMKAQAELLARTFDTLDAACIVQEMHETNEHLDAGDAVAAYGTLSETLGFVRNLKYNTGARVISDEQYGQLGQLLDPANPEHPDYYTFVGVNAGLTTAQIEAKTKAIEDLIQQVYGFSDEQMPLL